MTNKSHILSASLGLSAMIGGAVGYNLGYKRAETEFSTELSKEIVAARIESDKPISQDNSLRVHFITRKGATYTCDDSIPWGQTACSVNRFPGIGMVGLDAYSTTSNVVVYFNKKSF